MAYICIYGVDMAYICRYGVTFLIYGITLIFLSYLRRSYIWHESKRQVCVDCVKRHICAGQQEWCCKSMRARVCACSLHICEQTHVTMYESAQIACVRVLQCVAVCYSVLQCIAVCCSVLQCPAVCCSVLQCVAVCCSVLQCVAVCCSVLQCAAVCCSVSQCVAVA